MKTAELLKERYPQEIYRQYSESRELSFIRFSGHDMIEFAEYYHQQKLEWYSIYEKAPEPYNSYLCAVPFGNRFTFHVLFFGQAWPKYYNVKYYRALLSPPQQELTQEEEQ